MSLRKPAAGGRAANVANDLGGRPAAENLPRKRGRQARQAGREPHDKDQKPGEGGEGRQETREEIRPGTRGRKKAPGKQGRK